MIGYPFDFQCDLLHQIFSVLWETLDRCSKVWIEFEFVSDIKGSNCAMLLIMIL